MTTTLYVVRPAKGQEGLRLNGDSRGVSACSARAKCDLLRCTAMTLRCTAVTLRCTAIDWIGKTLLNSGFLSHLSHPRRRFFHVQGYTRRQLKQDKLAETAQGAALWTASHRRPVIYAAVALIVIVLAVTAFVAWQSRQNEAANIALSGAMRVFTANLRPAGAPATPDVQTFPSLAERGKAAQREFKAVADKYPHTDAGKIARYLEGVSAMQAGDNAAAERQLKAASDAGDKNVAALAKMALASYYRSANRAADATRIYKDLADHPTETVSKAAAQLAMAETYENTDPQQAKALYQQIQRENPTSAAGQTAGAKLTGGQGGAANLSPE
jgi:tetratricopeptide (TPR) repeat protein